MQQNEHSQRTICQGKTPIGGGNKSIVADGDRHSGFLQAGADLGQQIDHTAHITPFVIVPGKNFDLSFIDDHG